MPLPSSEPTSAHPMQITWPDPARQTAFQAWLAPVAARHGLDPASLVPASADASFRRYFRLSGTGGGAGGSRIVMDAPPSHEDCRPFVAIARLLKAAGLHVPEVLEWDEAGLHVPEVLEWDEAGGFLLLTDLGSQTYLSALNAGQPDAPLNSRLYGDAGTALVRLQGVAAEGVLPAYDEALLRRELDLFPQWYLQRHLGLTLDAGKQAELERVFRHLLDNNLAQARVLVHRDYHCRNLMVSEPNPGVLDFQDAVFGPITYDLVSLLRDAYIEWPEEVQIDHAVRHWERSRKAGLPVPADFADFWRDFEWMGVQRQLKVLGIFARLAHRDGKQGYLDDIPRVWRYAHRAAMRYRPLQPLAVLLERAAGEQRQSGYTF